jgi:hypothetical protein
VLFVRVQTWFIELTSPPNQPTLQQQQVSILGSPNIVHRQLPRLCSPRLMLQQRQQFPIAPTRWQHLVPRALHHCHSRLLVRGRSNTCQQVVKWNRVGRIAFVSLNRVPFELLLLLLLLLFLLQAPQQTPPFPTRLRKRK